MSPQPIVSCHCEPAGEYIALRASEEEACDRFLLSLQNTWVVYKGKMFIWPCCVRACKANLRPPSGHVDDITVLGACAEEVTWPNRKPAAVGARLSQHSPLLRVGPGTIFHQALAHKYTSSSNGADLGTQLLDMNRFEGSLTVVKASSCTGMFSEVCDPVLQESARRTPRTLSHG